MEDIDYSSLPTDLVAVVLNFLPRTDAFQAALTCRSWFAVFQSPLMWRRFVLKCVVGSVIEERALIAIDLYGSAFRTVTIKVDQFREDCRSLAVEAIRRIALIPDRQVQDLTVYFVGDNPIFYRGEEFCQAICSFADCKLNVRSTIRRLDLSHIHISMTDDIILRFAHHFATLIYVNLQNKQLICQFSPMSLLPLVSEARQLRDLRVCLLSMSSGMLRKLAEHGSIRHLSLLCRRQDKFEHSDLAAEVWDELVAATDGQLAVTLRFDCACGLNLTLAKAEEIMKRNIPVTAVDIETYTLLYPMLDIISDSYAQSLLTLNVTTLPVTDLDRALLLVAERCTRLRQLHVHCAVDPITKDRLTNLLPSLQLSTGEPESDLN